MEGAKVWLDKSADIEDALVVCCFPSVGMVSSVVAHFLIDHLELEFIGGVAHPKLPAICLVQDGVPLPAIRAYSGKPICKLPFKAIRIAAAIAISRPPPTVCPFSAAITNFGVWSSGMYGYTLQGLYTCFILAIPFFGYSIVSTLIFSSLIEIFYKLYQTKLVKQ